MSEADIVYGQMIDEEAVRAAMEVGTRFVFDLYNAVPAEAIGAERIGGFDTQPQMDEVFHRVVAFFRLCMRAGSYFVTSNERQRDFWIGYMIAADGLVPSGLAGRTASDVVGLLPFGMEDDEPSQASHGIRGKLGVPEDATVLLWAGGIWDWFDAETPIRAVAALRRDHPNLHLVFYGTRHPNALIGRPKSVERAESLASELGILDDGVHFIDGWVPASQRADYLLDADIAISAHKNSFETRYSFRTRVLDHFWASLPSIVTEGDWFADYIREHGLGAVVPYADVEATRGAILELLDHTARSATRARVVEVRDSWRWSQTTRELVDVIANWETRLAPRDLGPVAAAVEEVHDATSLKMRIRRHLSGTWIGMAYRHLRRR